MYYKELRLGLGAQACNSSCQVQGLPRQQSKFKASLGNKPRPRLKMRKKYKREVRGWRGGSVNSICCSCRGPGLGSQCGSSQLTIVPVPWDLAPSSGFYGHQACLQCTFTQASQILGDMSLERQKYSSVVERFHGMHRP